MTACILNTTDYDDKAKKMGSEFDIELTVVVSVVKLVIF